MKMQIEYIPPKYKKRPMPCGITGPMARAWEYLNNREGFCRASEFDCDFAPIGPTLRNQLSAYGLLSSTSGKTTIIYFPSP